MSRTSTSPAFGSARSTSSIVSGAPNSRRTAAWIRTGRLSSKAMARIRPFTALRYDVPDLAAVVAPPYDVISDEERAELRARSPYNVVHLTLPDSEEQAALDLAAWRESGALVEDEEP